MTLKFISVTVGSWVPSFGHLGSRLWVCPSIDGESRQSPPKLLFIKNKKKFYNDTSATETCIRLKPISTSIISLALQ